MAKFVSPIPNGPFYSNPSYSISQPHTGTLIVGSGMSVTAAGALLASSTAGGTVSSITAGTGLSGGVITTFGTIALLPPTSSVIGGVRAGANVTIDPLGVISVAAPNPGTITGVNAGVGLSGGGPGGSVTLNLDTASTVQLGGVIVGPTLSIAAGVLNVPQASSVTQGTTTFATSAETVVGTAANKAVTPAGLSAKVATTAAAGIVQLNDSTTSASSSTAATSNAVKTVADAVSALQTSVAGTLSLAGGLMTGPITFAPTQTFPGVSLPQASTTVSGVVRIGSGLFVSPSGILSTTNNGTVTTLIMGPGIGAPASGDTITSTGTIRLLPPSTTGNIGGVKAGSNILIAVDGTLTTQGLLKLNNNYAYNSYIFPTEELPGRAPGANGSYLRIKNNITGELEWATSGLVSQIDTGAGLTGGPITTTGTISLAASGVLPVGSVPATFGATGLIPTITVDAYGRVVSAGQAFPFAPFQIPTISAPFNLTLNFADNNTNWDFTLQGNTTLINPSNVSPGMRGTIVIRQNPVTPYSLTFGNAWKFANATPPVVSNVAAAVDVLDFVVVSTGYVVVLNYVKGVG